MTFLRPSCSCFDLETPITELGHCCQAAATHRDTLNLPQPQTGGTKHVSMLFWFSPLIPLLQHSNHAFIYFHLDQLVK